MTPLEPSLKFMPGVVRENCTEAVNHSGPQRRLFRGWGGGDRRGDFAHKPYFIFFVFASLDHAHVLVADEPAFDIPPSLFASPVWPTWLTWRAGLVWQAPSGKK